MNLIISNSSETPIYAQIKQAIIEQILNNDLLENDMLPSIRTLAKDIHISVMTIKKAYDELESEGYITTKQGKGSFIASKNLELFREEQKKKMEKSLLEAIELSKLVDLPKRELGELLDYLYEEDE